MGKRCGATPLNAQYSSGNRMIVNLIPRRRATGARAWGVCKKRSGGPRKTAAGGLSPLSLPNPRRRRRNSGPAAPNPKSAKLAGSGTTANEPPVFSTAHATWFVVSTPHSPRLNSVIGLNAPMSCVGCVSVLPAFTQSVPLKKPRFGSADPCDGSYDNCRAYISLPLPKVIFTTSLINPLCGEVNGGLELLGDTSSWFRVRHAIDTVVGLAASPRRIVASVPNAAAPAPVPETPITFDIRPS